MGGAEIIINHGIDIISRLPYCLGDYFINIELDDESSSLFSISKNFITSIRLEIDSRWIIVFSKISSASSVANS